MGKDTFAGDKKAPMRSPLAAIEKKFILANVGRFPLWVQSWQLTMLTIPLSAGLILFGWLAARNPHWLWLSSLMLLGQWFTDSFDGALGRHRDAGLVKWGFYMDHFLDFLFMSAVFLGYLFILPGDAARLWMIALMLTYQAVMVSSWLSFAATNEFKITYLGLGPTEIRLLFIFVNTALIFAGPGWLVAALPWVTAAWAAMLCVIVYGAHRVVWGLDMAAKRARAEGGE